MRNKTKYLSNDDLLEQVVESKKNDYPTVDFCRMVQMIADHMLTGRSFFKYSASLKEEMRSHALLVSIKALKSFDPKKTSNSFGYWTRTIWTAFLQVLNSHYKQVNLKKELIRKQMAEFDRLNGGKRLERFESEEWDD